MIRVIRRIRSGGQSGVDRAALDIAKKYGVETCGWCPKGGWAEDYPDPPGLLADYPELEETPQEGTSQRTRWNMRDADAILTILPEGSQDSPGTMLGMNEGGLLGKPMLTASGPEDVPEILAWLNTLSENTFPDGIELCVGGPRASECGNAYEVAAEILEGVLGKKLCHEKIGEPDPEPEVTYVGTEIVQSDDRIEQLLQMPYWIIDILPKRVPKDSPGQYFAVEAYFLEEQISVIKQKHANVILKLNCYMDITIDGEVNPAPDRIADRIHEQYAYILAGDALFLSEPDETYVTLFHPDEQLLELVKDLAASEGLFVWKGSEEQDK